VFVSNFIVFEFSDKFFHVMLSECFCSRCKSLDERFKVYRYVLAHSVNWFGVLKMWTVGRISSFWGHPANLPSVSAVAPPLSECYGTSEVGASNVVVAVQVPAITTCACLNDWFVARGYLRATRFFSPLCK